MSNDTPPPTDPAATPTPSKLPPAVRQRLDQVFQHARRSFDKGDHDYAHDLYAQCVSEDRVNLAYAQHFRANLTKKWGAGKKSSSFGGLLSKTSRGAIEKAAAKGKWEDAFAAGCAGLKKNPGDVGALQALAAACGELESVDCQLFYLRWAMDIDPTDVESNRQAAAALASIGEFDQAIACWKRVQQQKPNDEESAKQIARLSVEKTIHQGGYNTELLKKASGETTITTPRVADLASKESDGTPRQSRSGETTLVEGEADDFDAQEKRLLEKIADSPGAEANYLELAELYASEDRLQDAERLLNKALSTIGGSGDSVIRDRLEDFHLRRVRRQVEIAQTKFEKQRTTEAKELLARMVKQANQAELDVYVVRAGRSPGDTRLQFELGLRQKRMGDYRGAINSFQAARGDSQRAAETQILLGECFQHIDQYKLAISSYEAAVEASRTTSSGSASGEVRKLALYRVGVLAMGLKDYDRADQRLTELAGLDFSYRDVADRLDKIAAMRNDT